MKLSAFCFCLIFFLIIILSFNWVSFVSYTNQDDNSINLSKESIFRLNKLDLSFFRVNPIDNNKFVYDSLLKGDYDSELIEIARFLDGKHYVSIAPILNLNSNLNDYLTEINKQNYLNVYNYISHFLNAHAEGDVMFVFEVSLVPSEFRVSNTHFSFYDKSLNCDIVGLNLNSFDPNLFSSFLSIETVLDLYLEKTQLNPNIRVSLIDIPDSLLNKSFFQLLSSTLNEYSYIISRDSFFSYHELESSFNKIYGSFCVSLARTCNVFLDYFSNLKVVQGRLFYFGSKDYDFDISVGDDYVVIEFFDDDLVEYRLTSNEYDRIYMCDDVSTKANEGYMFYSENNKFFMLNLETFDSQDIYNITEVNSKKRLKISLDQLTNCNDFFSAPIQIIDYDNKNSFTVLHYLN